MVSYKQLPSWNTIEQHVSITMSRSISQTCSWGVAAGGGVAWVLDTKQFHEQRKIHYCNITRQHPEQQQRQQQIMLVNKKHTYIDKKPEFSLHKYSYKRQEKCQ